MVPGLKFSRTTSALATSLRRMACPSGAFMLRVRLFLLRLTERKYVASPPENGGQPRVSSPLPGSSTLITSAPMSPRIIEQNGPASTRVRSRTRTPASGRSARGTLPPLPHPLGETPRDRVDAVAGVAGAPPEQPRALHRPQVGEIIDIVDRLDRHPGADFDPAGVRAVADEAAAAAKLDDGEVQRRAEPGGRRVQRGEGDNLADAGQRGRGHRHRVMRTVRRRRRD